MSQRRESSASAERLWEAAQTLRLRDARRLGRLVRWRIPGLAADLAFDELFRAPPFIVLDEQPGRLLVSGLVGRIWTLRRDYPDLEGPDEFRHWNRSGTARVVFANWIDESPEHARDDPCRGTGRRDRRPGQDRGGGRPAPRPRLRLADRQRRYRDRGAARGATTLKQTPESVASASNVTAVSAFESEVTVRRTRYSNPETGWAVLEAAAPTARRSCSSARLIHLEERERARVSGPGSTTAATAGRSRSPRRSPLPPSDTDAEAVLAYLVRVRHVGAKRRAAPGRPLRAGEDVRRDRRRSTRRPSPPAGVRGGALAEATRSWERLRVTRRLHLLLAPHGLAYLASRIRETYGDGAHRLVSERPYELTSVFGVGFLIADRIARTLGTAADGPRAHARGDPPHAVGGRARRQHLHAAGPAPPPPRTSCSAPRQTRPRPTSTSWWTTAISPARSAGSTARRPPSSRPSWRAASRS